ncbi:MAG: glycosyltransferase family 39 protein [Myxococcota bacterium]
MNRLALAALLAAAFLLALGLRVFGADHPFESADNVELALRAMNNRNIVWIFGERYGYLNPLSVKLGSAIWSDAFGQTMTEAMWKLPVALMGAAQTLLAYAFARRLGASEEGSIGLAFVTAVLPLHVMQSRYLWGYEVFGVFFLCLALWALLNFLERPSHETSLTAGASVALYLVSHGFVVPFFPSVVALFLLIRGREAWSLVRTHRALWLLPAMYLPFLAPAIQHTSDKQAQAGFYLFRYLEPAVANLGVPIALVVVAGWTLGRKHLPLLTIALLYFAPLMFGARPGSTVARGYMLVGSYLLTFGALLNLDRLIGGWPKRLGFAVLVALTGWGTVAAIRGTDGVMAIRIERGGIPNNPGTKAAGLYVREHVGAEHRILAVGVPLEPPTVEYYLGREATSFYDLPPATLQSVLDREIDGHDVVLAPNHLALPNSFQVVAEFEGSDLVVSSRVPLPSVRVSVAEADVRFDRTVGIRALF